MGMQRFTALPCRGTYGNDFAGLLFDHVRHGKMNDGVHAGKIHANHVVPLLLGHFVDRQIVAIPDTGIGNHDVEAPCAGYGEVHQLFVIRVAANVGFESFYAGAVFCRVLLHLRGRLLGFVIIENHVRSSLSEEFDCRRANASGTSGNQRRLARQ